jgi:hypothetical protein
MQNQTPQAVQSAHELLVWLIPQLDKLPRARRFTLGERLEAGVLAILENLIEAAYTRNKEQVSRVSEGLDVLGYLVYPHRRRLRNDNGHRFAQRLRRMAAMYADDRLDWAAIDASVQSWIGHARHADTGGLRRAIFSRIIFRRGTDREATSV